MIDRIRRILADLDRWSQRHASLRITRRAIDGFIGHEALQYAGSMAYFGVLSIFQLLVLGVVVASVVIGEGQARDFILDQVEAGSPLDRESIGGVLDAIASSRGGITIIGCVFLLWSSLGVFSALSTGVGRAFEAAPRRGLLADRLLGLFLMAVTGVLAVGSFVIGLATAVVQSAAADVLSRTPGGGWVVSVLGLLLPLVLIFGAFWIIYRVVPNRALTFGEVLPGALVATALWTLLRFGFTFYVTDVARYDSAFGPIATGITLLVFLYFASVIVLLGAEVARASVLDTEAHAPSMADASLPPMPVEATAQAALGRRSGPPRWLLVAGGALIGLVAGRLSKRDEDE